MKKVFCLWVSFLLVINVCLPVYADENTVADISEYYNPDYEEYVKSLQGLSEEEFEKKLLLAPSEYSYNEDYVSDTNMYATRSSYSSTYDSIQGMSFDLKDIDSYPSSGIIGWSFAASDALEIYLRKKCSVNKDDCGFSAIHLMSQMSSTKVPDTYAMSDSEFFEGNFAMAAAYWLRNEHSLENEKIKIMDTVSLSDLSRWSSEEQSENRINSIKRMIMDYGGVYTKYELFTDAFDQYYSSYNNNDGGEIISGRTIESGVVIIGWDDNYAIEKFGESKPSRPGAFKVLTNRVVESNVGTIHLGTYYISYDMVNFLNDISAVKKAFVGSYAKNTYEYDKKAHSGISHSNTTTNVYANKYISSNGDVEKIKSITTYCEVPNSYFNVYISKDGSMTNLEKVNIKGSSSSGYNVSNMGYVTMELSDELIIDSDFTVAIEVRTPMTSAKSIPQERMPVDIASISGRCFVANNISDMKNGNYIDQGSRNNIIKVHVVAADKQWKFDDSEFDEVKNNKVSDVNIKGLSINGNIDFSNSNKRIKGTTFYNYALMTKTNDYKEKSLSFYVNGPSKIYIIGKSNSENITRRIAVYSEATKKTEYVNMSVPNGYSYSYDGEAGYIYMYAVDDNIRIYSVAHEEYNEDDWYSLDEGDEKEWDFTDLYSMVIAQTGLAKITDNIEYNGMYLYADAANYMIAVKNESTSKSGFRYFYGLDLEGSGSDSYRTIAFDVNRDSDIYITARTSGSATGELYLTNKYGCNLDTDINKESLTISSDIVTYKIHYNGYGERVYLRSKDSGIRLMNIVVDSCNIYTADEHRLEPSNIDEFVIDSAITNMKVNDYTISANSPYQVKVIAANETGYTKALRLIGAEHLESGSKISFYISDSRGTNASNPVRKIRVKAKSNVSGSLLILADKYGYVIDAKPLTTTLSEYEFDYSGDKTKLNLFTYNRGFKSFADIYSISKSDVEYYTYDKVITLTKDSNNQGSCIVSVNNVPFLSKYRFKIVYDETKLSYAGFDKVTALNNSAIVSDQVNVSNNTYGERYVSVRFYGTEKTNWSGILGTIRFNFLGDNEEADIKIIAEY